MKQLGVQITRVSKEFGAHTALHDINLSINSGEFVSLLGPSGCGKTTLLRIISGFEEATTGSVQIHGVDVTNTPPHLRNTNIVFQRGALFPHMNVAENIGYSLKLRRLSKAQIAIRVEEMLVLVKLEGLASRGPNELSGGQVQRVALARALASEPSVLLLDEPLSALDLKLRQHMQLELRTIQRELGATFIYVTHDQTEALVMSDRIAVMNDGRIVQVGSPREIYANPANEFASDFIGETNLFHGIVEQIDVGLVHIKLRSGQMLVGRGTNLKSGQPVTLSVRPESIRVTASASLDSSKWRISGRILDVIFLGSRTRLQIDIGEGTFVLADLGDDESIDLIIGSSVELSWHTHQANVWQLESGESTASGTPLRGGSECACASAPVRAGWGGGAGAVGAGVSRGAGG